MRIFTTLVFVFVLMLGVADAKNQRPFPPCPDCTCVNPGVPCPPQITCPTCAATRVKHCKRYKTKRNGQPVGFGCRVDF